MSRQYGIVAVVAVLATVEVTGELAVLVAVPAILELKAVVTVVVWFLGKEELAVDLTMLV